MIRNAAVYFGSSIINKLVPFLFIPILTRMLTPEEFGLLSLYQVAITFGIALCGFCLHMNIARNYARLGRGQFAELNTAVLVVLLVSCGTVLGLSFLLGHWFVDPLSLPNIWWWSIPVVAFFSMLLLIVQTVYRAAEQPLAYAGFEVGAAVISVLLTIVFLFLFQWRWEGRALALALTPVLVGSVAIFLHYKRGGLSHSINRDRIRDVALFSLPLLPHALSSAVMGVSDRFILAEFQDLSDVGLYSLGYSFGMVIFLLTDAVAKVWSPYVLNNYDRTGGRFCSAMKAKLLKIFVVFMVVVSCYSFCIQLLLPHIVGEAFWSAGEYIIVICFAYFFFGIYQLFFPFLVAFGASKRLGAISTVCALMNIILTYAFVSVFGGIGAAYATLITFLFLSTLVGGLSVYLHRGGSSKAHL